MKAVVDGASRAHDVSISRHSTIALGTREAAADRDLSWPRTDAAMLEAACAALAAEPADGLPQPLGQIDLRAPADALGGGSGVHHRLDIVGAIGKRTQIGLRAAGEGREALGHFAHGGQPSTTDLHDAAVDPLDRRTGDEGSHDVLHMHPVHAALSAGKARCETVEL